MIFYGCQDSRKVLKAHRILIHPTPEHAAQMWRACGIRRSAWNWALSMMGDLYEAYKRGECERPSVGEVAKMYRRARPEWAGEFGSYIYDQAMRDLDKAFQSFFRRVKSGETPGYPKFKSRYDNSQGFYVHNRQMALDGNTLHINAFGSINMAEPLRFEGKVMGGRVTKRAGNWYITIQVETGTEPPDKREGAIVGVDVGIKTLAVTSDGKEYQNPRSFERNERLLARLQRIQARKKDKSSKRYQKLKLRIQRVHEDIAEARRDVLHKMTNELTEQYATIAIEDLNVKGLSRSKLAKQVTDAAFGEMRRQLEYKAEWRGGEIVRVGRFYASSKMCSACGEVNTKLTLSDRKWTCQHCGAVHDRDFNAAVNIRDEAIRIAAAGKCSHPAVSLTRKGRTSRAEVGVHEAGL